MAIVWASLVGTFVLACILRSPVLVAISFLGPMVASVVTLRVVVREADLEYRRLYRALVVPLLLTSAATAVLCGRTLFFSSSGPLFVVGFTALGATNVAVMILAWRALVAPSTRRAAFAGMVAVCAESIAMVVDININMHVPGFGSQPETGFALLAALLAIAAGVLACVAALVAFGPDLPDVPEARVVDGD